MRRMHGDHLIAIHRMADHEPQHAADHRQRQHHQPSTSGQVNQAGSQIGPAYAAEDAPPRGLHPALPIRPAAIDQRQHHDGRRAEPAQQAVAACTPYQESGRIKTQGPQLDRDPHRRFVIGLFGVDHEQTDDDQAKRARDDLPQGLTHGARHRQPVIQAEWNRGADHEQKRREHHIGQAHAVDTGSHVLDAVGDAIGAGKAVHEQHDEKSQAT